MMLGTWLIVDSSRKEAKPRTGTRKTKICAVKEVCEAWYASLTLTSTCVFLQHLLLMPQFLTGSFILNDAMLLPQKCRFMVKPFAVIKYSKATNKIPDFFNILTKVTHPANIKYRLIVNKRSTPEMVRDASFIDKKSGLLRCFCVGFHFIVCHNYNFYPAVLRTSGFGCVIGNRVAFAFSLRG